MTRPAARARRGAVVVSVALVPVLAVLGRIHPALSRELGALAGAVAAAGLLLRFAPDLTAGVTTGVTTGLAPAPRRSGPGPRTPTGLYVSFMRRPRNTPRTFMSIGPTPAAASIWSHMMDFLFIAGGVGIFGLFALYTVLLRRI